MSELAPGKLTPQQSADVIRWLWNDANEIYRKNGWDDKVCIARMALSAARLQLERPDGAEKPMLTWSEASEGHAAIEAETSGGGRLSTQEELAAEKLVDAGVATLHDARKMVAS